MPVLVLHGADDPLVPARNAIRLARRTGGALHLIDGAGHAYHADAPDATRSAVLAFLEHADAVG
jgi:pimeloyl-ACP methyl ester carboxylesterase